MFQLGLVEAMQADREREIKAAIRIRQQLRPENGLTEPTEPMPAPSQATKGRTLAVRARQTAR
jgi:hypothetical protein